MNCLFLRLSTFNYKRRKRNDFEGRTIIIWLDITKVYSSNKCWFQRPNTARFIIFAIVASNGNKVTILLEDWKKMDVDAPRSWGTINYIWLMMLVNEVLFSLLQVECNWLKYLFQWCNLFSPKYICISIFRGAFVRLNNLV